MKRPTEASRCPQLMNNPHAALNARLDQLARTRPQLFRVRAVGTLALGYAGCGALAVAPAAACAIGLLALARAAPLVFEALGVAALLVLVLLSFPRAAAARNLPGERVDPTQAAELLKLLERLRARLRLRYPREVRITPQFDAALFQDSNSGVFGGGARRSVLLLGLPLIKCLSEKQLEAVIAHELGHLAGALASHTSRARHLGISLQRLREGIAREPGRLWRTLRRTLEWYLSQLEACTLPLARINEADADRIAVRLTSPSALGQALVTHRVGGIFWYRRYWPWVGNCSRTLAPQFLFPYSDFGLAAFQGVPEDERGRWLETSLRFEATPTASHPILRERLRAIGVRAELVLPDQGADRLLRADRARLDALFDQRWRAGTVAARRLLQQAIEHRGAGP